MNKKINELIAENIMQWHHDQGTEKQQEECPNGIWRDSNGNGICHYDSFRPTEQVKEANWVIGTMVEKGLIDSDKEFQNKEPYYICLKALSKIGIEFD